VSNHHQSPAEQNLQKPDPAESSAKPADKMPQKELNLSISGISSQSTLAQTGSTSVLNQLKQDFKQLATALQSGNLAGAQKAFKGLQQLLQSNQSGSQSSNKQPASSSNNPIQSDFAALGKALASGNLSSAQSAFSQLQTDMQAAGSNGASGAQSAHHGHHHRHASSASDSTASTSTTDSQSASTGSTFSIYA
jgi:hypothetical protein